MGRPATAASDRYALAVVAYELLVGERPFNAENFAAQARQHVDGAPPRASEHNAALAARAGRGAGARDGQAPGGALDILPASLPRRLRAAMESRIRRGLDGAGTAEPTLERPRLRTSRPVALPPGALTTAATAAKLHHPPLR